MKTVSEQNISVSVSYSDELKISDKHAYLDVFRSFNWKPLISCKSEIQKYHAPYMTFSTSEGHVLQIGKINDAAFSVLMAFEDSEHPDLRQHCKRQNLTIIQVENLIKLYADMDIVCMRNWVNENKP
ncbi:hypothetical protein [Pseudoalteromonas denitrificans]|jgi:hypothetical protein|uniref:Uncharacterized protein n=1 Tax=Pseudoalteromonas denitrificans DSM 6059 TaxID=1123010 RepID=A0A1I1RGP8_9GAMM|nr:hypothetical protein [Pseudoalteromonas denitrificans]SFD33317.1 hypothetical protein SAMN02745724_04234 [Pseudoalteromonas denitrificans DSM 6059]